MFIEACTRLACIARGLAGPVDDTLELCLMTHRTGCWECTNYNIIIKQSLVYASLSVYNIIRILAYP